MEPDNVSVGKDAYRAMLTQQVNPVICARMPLPPHGDSITIQQDNAPPHIAPTDPPFCQAVLNSGRYFALWFQPPNSPDLNYYDLGLFSAVQARQRQTRTIDELIEATESSFWELPPSTVNAAFLSLQCSMDGCIRANGGNDSRIDHMAKAKLERERRLPDSIKCSNVPDSFVHMMTDR
ncbi:unnamed protein product [Phytophthora fragariaefolia]|uniref:Unnamed protein product n=1 Tax=Phytophthora fragariaefolia TaxID=1490495 RepID=A0A9W7CZY8_9STRA|nr:unnamed protein product [Phytophthora fragariaefolia]